MRDLEPKEEEDAVAGVASGDLDGGGDSDPASDDSSDDSNDDFLRAVAAAPAQRPLAGLPESLTRVAHFKIVEMIGRGGMGIVYRAEDEKLERVVALKVLPEDFDDDVPRRRRFFREARVAAAISHPNVATVHEVGEADGRIYIAMELVEGTTLRKQIEGGALPIGEALRIARDIARGVAKAHARGVAHRDLKPDNVMIGAGGSVKVLDFGLAKPVEIGADDHETVTWTQEGRIVGTPGYMSPEQATGRAVGLRTDVFSLGVILFEMLTGTRPFKGQTSMDVVIATSRDAHPAPSSIDPRLYPALEAAIDRCLKKDPADRFATIDELLAVLEGLDDVAPSSTRAKTLALALAAALIATAGVGTWWATRGPDDAAGVRIATESGSEVSPKAGLSGSTRPGVNANAVAPSSSIAIASSSARPVIAGAPPAIATDSASLVMSGAGSARPRVVPAPVGRVDTRAPPAVASSGVGLATAPAGSAAETRGGVIEKSPY